MESMDQSAARRQMLSFLGIQAVAVQAISTAANLGIADLVSGEPRTSDELAVLTGTNSDALRRLLDALCSMDVFRRDADRRYYNTPLSDTLRLDRPDSLHGWALHMGSPVITRTMEGLSQSVTTGGAVFSSVFGNELFGYFAQTGEAAAIFGTGMSSFSASCLSEALDAYDFSAVKRLADVGGGQGALLRGILSANKNVEGVLFDQPKVVELLIGVQDSVGAPRFNVVGGDFFDGVPANCDLYLLRHILHNWPDEKATAILRNCRRAMAPGGKVLILEILLKDTTELDFGRFLDLTMLTLLGGRERTLAEYERVLEPAGLRVSRVFPTKGFHTFVEAEAI